MPRPREPPIFFIDHCLGTEKVAHRLRSEGVEVRILVEEGFAENADDVEWLPVVAAKPWIVQSNAKPWSPHARAHLFLWLADWGEMPSPKHSPAPCQE